MTTEEFDEMRALLKRYVETEMGQWSMWRTTTQNGSVYISITRAPEPGATDDAYDPF